jgi:hypothetical protein
MRTISKALVVAVLIGLCSVGAHAQEATGNTIQNPVSFRVGSVWPGSATTRANTGYAPLSLGADYAIAESSNVPPAFTSVYFDYAGGSSQGGSAYFWALGLALRTYPDTNNGNTSGGVSNNIGQQIYYGGGLGLYHSYAKNGANGSSGDSTNIGFKAFTGFEFSQTFLLELNYNIVPDADGIGMSGFGLQIGKRF